VARSVPAPPGGLDSNPHCERELRRALALREKTLGPRDPATAILINNLADVVQAQCKYAEAEQLHRRVLAVFEKTWGDHPRTAASLNNLGANLHAQGRHAAAEPVLRRALAMKERTLGPNSPSVAHTLGNLAQVAAALGRQAEADRLAARAAKIHRGVKGIPGK